MEKENEDSCTDAVLPDCGRTFVVMDILELPDDILFAILSHCDLKTLSSISQTCKQLARLAAARCVWARQARKFTLVLGDGVFRQQKSVPLKELCRLSLNWCRGDRTKKTSLIHYKVRQMPWLQMTSDNLWISEHNQVHCYRQKHSGKLSEIMERKLVVGQHDVSRFVCKQGQIFTGSVDGVVGCYQEDTGHQLWQVQHSLRNEGGVQAVDAHGELVVSGARNATVKLWRMSRDGGQLQAELQHIDMEDRVWSLALDPQGRCLVVGTACLGQMSPLRMWDTHTGELISSLGVNYRRGAGVLDIQFETPSTLLTCGHDTIVRLWDLRLPTDKCVSSWMEPFDYTIYCVRSDGANAIVAGTSHHGMVRLWDKRRPEPVQMHYAQHMRSPVYSLCFDPGHLYLALDKVVFAQSNEARCYVENEDVVGAAPTGDAPTTSE